MLATNPAALGFYFGSFANGYLLPGGTAFTFTGSSGKNVGSFNVTVTVPNPPLNWTNKRAIQTVTRAQGVTVNWTGGDPNTDVLIGGSSTSGSLTVSFVCFAPTTAQTFTVPAYILLALPAGKGSLTLFNGTTPVSFTATGINYGYASVTIGFQISPTYN
jgi:hypothetical protein